MTRENSIIRIKDAAREVFFEKGFQGATLAQIAAVAGISPALIYRYFKNKKELFTALGQPELDFPKPSLQARKKEIIKAALRVFSRRGFAAATMDEIAEEAGLSKAALYLDFSSKEELFSGLVSNPPSFEYMEEIFSVVFNDQEKSLSESLHYIARAYLDLFEDPQVLALTRIILVEGTRSPLVSGIFRESIIGRGTDLLCKYLSSSGQPKIDDLKIKVRAFFGILFSQVLLWRVLVQMDLDAEEAFQKEKESLVSLAVSMFLNSSVQN